MGKAFAEIVGNLRSTDNHKLNLYPFRYSLVISCKERGTINILGPGYFIKTEK